VTSLGDIVDGFAGAISVWRRVQWAAVNWAGARVAITTVGGLIGLTLLRLMFRRMRPRPERPPRVVLPAILPAMRRSRSALRFVPFCFFLAGMPFFVLALADPRTTLRHEDATYPGRRIAIVIDGSTSMIFRFPLSELKSEGGDHAYYAAVSGAERLLQLRMRGLNRDIIGLIQFGDQAYVITPFTTDYSNVVLALRLISDPDEWGRFPDYGTTIIKALDEAISLFDRFQFLNATGNMMVVFTDGRDDQMELRGQTLDELCRKAASGRIPIYLVRTAFASPFGEVRQDAIWKAAVEKTGGRFYVAADERSLLSAIDEINRLAPDKMVLRTYASHQPQFQALLFLAVCCWLTALVFTLYVPRFRTFP